MTVRGSTAANLRRAIPAYVLLVLLIVVTAALSPVFTSERNVVNVVRQSAPLALVTLGQTFALILAGIDLSIGSVVSLTTVILSFTGAHGSLPFGTALAIALAAGLGVGLVNGLGVVYLRIHPLLMTLGTMAVVKGAALYIRSAPGGSVYSPFARFLNQHAGPVAYVGVLVALAYLVGWVVLSFTRLGRSLYATGNDPESARRSGLRTARTTVTGYVLASLLGTLAGIVLAARIYSGDALIGDAYTLDSVAAGIIGGASLFGGVGSVVGAFAGAVLLAIVNNILNLLNVYSYYQYIAKGLILFGALVAASVRERAGRRAS